jgi:hypothetical protein
MLAAMSLGMLGVFTASNARRRRPRKYDDAYGTARFATEKEIRDSGLMPGLSGVYVGAWTDRKGELRYLRHDGPEHIGRRTDPLRQRRRARPAYTLVLARKRLRGVRRRRANSGTSPQAGENSTPRMSFFAGSRAARIGPASTTSSRRSGSARHTRSPTRRTSPL